MSLRFITLVLLTLIAWVLTFRLHKTVQFNDYEQSPSDVRMCAAYYIWTTKLNFCLQKHLSLSAILDMSWYILQFWGNIFLSFLEAMLSWTSENYSFTALQPHLAVSLCFAFSVASTFFELNSSVQISMSQAQ